MFLGTMIGMDYVCGVYSKCYSALSSNCLVMKWLGLIACFSLFLCLAEASFLLVQSRDSSPASANA